MKKTKSKTIMLSPREATTEKKILTLQSDNSDTKNAWILIDGPTVVVAVQKNGKPLVQSIKILRKDFDRLIDWYNKPQKARVE